MGAFVPGVVGASATYNGAKIVADPAVPRGQAWVISGAYARGLAEPYRYRRPAPPEGAFGVPRERLEEECVMHGLKKVREAYPNSRILIVIRDVDALTRLAPSVTKLRIAGADVSMIHAGAAPSIIRGRVFDRIVFQPNVEIPGPLKLAIASARASAAEKPAEPRSLLSMMPTNAEIDAEEEVKAGRVYRREYLDAPNTESADYLIERALDAYDARSDKDKWMLVVCREDARVYVERQLFNRQARKIVVISSESDFQKMRGRRFGVEVRERGLMPLSEEVEEYIRVQSHDY